MLGEPGYSRLPLQDARLASAVRDQTAWLLAAPAAVDVRPPHPDLSAERVSLVADVTELMLFLLAADAPLPSAELSVLVSDDAILIEAAVPLAGRLDLNVVGARLRELASAVAATVDVDDRPPSLRARLALQTTT